MRQRKRAKIEDAEDAGISSAMQMRPAEAPWNPESPKVLGQGGDAPLVFSVTIRQRVRRSLGDLRTRISFFTGRRLAALALVGTALPARGGAPLEDPPPPAPAEADPGEGASRARTLPDDPREFELSPEEASPTTAPLEPQRPSPFRSERASS